jgi:hypothetical protein
MYFYSKGSIVEAVSSIGCGDSENKEQTKQSCHETDKA